MRLATANKDLEKWGIKNVAYKGVFNDERMDVLTEKHPELLESKVAIHNNQNESYADKDVMRDTKKKKVYGEDFSLIESEETSKLY